MNYQMILNQKLNRILINFFFLNFINNNIYKY